MRNGNEILAVISEVSLASETVVGLDTTRRTPVFPTSILRVGSMSVLLPLLGEIVTNGVCRRGSARPRKGSSRFLSPLVVENVTNGVKKAGRRTPNHQHPPQAEDAIYLRRDLP